MERFAATGAPVVTDGEQRKYHNFRTYCVHGLPNTESLLRSTPNIEMPEEVRDRSLRTLQEWALVRGRG
jgi:hypothetical protein